MKEGSEMLIISDDPSVVEDAAFDVMKCDGKIRLAAWRYEPQEAGGPEF